METVFDRSAVVFVCMRENDEYVVRKIYKAEVSWGSNIKVGDVITGLPVRNDSRDAGVLVTREHFRVAANGQLAQGAIPFDRNGLMFFGDMTLRDVETYLEGAKPNTP